MARDTDRKKISEAVRRLEAWVTGYPTNALDRDRVYLSRRSNPSERLVIRYGVSGQIVTADHCFPGVRNGILTRKRERVLAIIEGRS
jgi:hypothetical protein